MPCFIALLQLHIGQSLDLQNHTRYNFLSPVSRFCLYSNISAQSFTLSAFLNSRICRRSKSSTLAIFFSLHGLTFPLFVLSTNTLDVSSEYILLLGHILLKDTPIHLVIRLVTNSFYRWGFSVQPILSVFNTLKHIHTNTSTHLSATKIKMTLFLYVSRIERTSSKPSKKHPFWVLFIIPYLYPFLYVFLVYLNAQIRL